MTRTTTRPPRWILILGALLCGLFTLACGSGAARSQGGASAASAPAAFEVTAAPETAPEATAAPASYAVGQDVQVDEVRWKMLSAEDLGQTLKSDNEFIKEKTTSARFVRVHFELENLSKDMASFMGLDLLDDEGRTFKPSSDAFGFIPTEEHCVLENLNPNVAKICTSIYEIPTNANGLKAQVTDLKIFGGQQMLVDLGIGAK